MSEHSVKVLVVDDLQEKLLVYRTVLESPELEVVTASSGPEALGKLLLNEFAVILLDVNMPGMDGYETAELVRKRKRSSHTPIIFVTAYADEMHALKGYSYGAVDYMLSPVVPDVLRTKVRVFTELHRLTQQVREHAARQVASADRERARLAAVLNRSADAFIQANAAGEIQHINPAGMQLLQCAHDDVRPASIFAIGISNEQVAIARRDGMWFGDAAIRNIHDEHIPVSQLLQAHLDEDRRVEAYSIIARDARERHRAQQATQQLAAIVESSDDAIIAITVDGIITSWNASAERLYGYSPEHAIGRSVMMLVPQERTEEERGILEGIRQGKRIVPFETVRVAKGGRQIDISLTISPLLDADGKVIGASKIAHDITVRKQFETELARHRTHLEELVRERTRELEKSHERLRLTDRLASIGTLAAGLGHDMGNLLLPIRARIASLEMLALPAAATEHVQAIKTAGDYLKRLSQGLRLFALDPTESSNSSGSTNLAVWWLDVEPFLRNALPKSIALEADIQRDLPPIQIAPHTFTQAIYNLVQNAGDCMGRTVADGLVRISAERGENDTTVVVRVADNGPGMTEEVRRRCLEPFFTTRTRGISTGLGLALVHGAVSNAKGQIDVASTPGKGTTFTLTLPAAQSATSGSANQPFAGVAAVEIADKRLAAYVSSMLKSMGVRVQHDLQQALDSPEPHILVMHGEHALVDDAIRAAKADHEVGLVLLAEAPNGESHPRIAWLSKRATASQIRECIQHMMTQLSSAEAATA